MGEACSLHKKDQLTGYEGTEIRPALHSPSPESWHWAASTHGEEGARS